jgi:hypothetical protein
VPDLGGDLMLANHLTALAPRPSALRPSCHPPSLPRRSVASPRPPWCSQHPVVQNCTIGATPPTTCPATTCARPPAPDGATCAHRTHPPLSPHAAPTTSSLLALVLGALVPSVPPPPVTRPMVQPLPLGAELHHGCNACKDFPNNDLRQTPGTRWCNLRTPHTPAAFAPRRWPLAPALGPSGLLPSCLLAFLPSCLLAFVPSCLRAFAPWSLLGFRSPRMARNSPRIAFNGVDCLGWEFMMPASGPRPSRPPRLLPVFPFGNEVQT